MCAYSYRSNRSRMLAEPVRPRELHKCIRKIPSAMRPHMTRSAFVTDKMIEISRKSREAWGAKKKCN